MRSPISRMTQPTFFAEDQALVEEALESQLPPEATAPATIHRAMRYSVFAGGKRIRPILCIETARLFSRTVAAAVAAGCAVEFIHTYSLIHDDLPALDNDDLRRGKPTCHKKFGEAMAILAGDALLTLAFETLARADVEPARRVQIIAEVGAAAGTVRGMVGGQVADLEAEGNPVDAAVLEYIHRSKTAALIRAAIVAGAIAGGASDADVERMRRFGDALGWEFQVVDDVLDVQESSAALGKTAGKDQAQKKATYPALVGVDQSMAFAKELAEKAERELACYGERASRLREIADFLVSRRA
ncbi:MAG TPA: farnesyl diphosphate synthase [Candidatus Acidoferrales bacterium]|nr:farnesyl diphosphate synthase [Candidatus Acidoferrales bacterium]